MQNITNIPTASNLTAQGKALTKIYQAEQKLLKSPTTPGKRSRGRSRLGAPKFHIRYCLIQPLAPLLSLALSIEKEGCISVISIDFYN